MTTLFTMTVDTEGTGLGRSWPTRYPCCFQHRPVAAVPGHLLQARGRGHLLHQPRRPERPGGPAELLDLARPAARRNWAARPPVETPRRSPARPGRPAGHLLNNLAPDLILRKLDTVYGHVRSTHGLRPTSFRGGRYSSGPVVQFPAGQGVRGRRLGRAVHHLGGRRCPGLPRPRTSYSGPPAAPPAGEHALLGTAADARLHPPAVPAWRHAGFEFIARTSLRHLRLIGIADRLGVVRKVWLNLRSRSAGRCSPSCGAAAAACPASASPSTARRSWRRQDGLHPDAGRRERLFAEMDEVFATLAGGPSSGRRP